MKVEIDQSLLEPVAVKCVRGFVSFDRDPDTNQMINAKPGDVVNIQRRWVRSFEAGNKAYEDHKVADEILAAAAALEKAQKAKQKAAAE